MKPRFHSFLVFFLLLFLHITSVNAQEPSSHALFDSHFLSPDTSRAEYAGLYVHYVLGGFSSRLQDYPNTLGGAFTPLQSSFRSFAFGAASDSPIRLPFLTKRQNNEWFKGLHFGMQVEAQFLDISITETSVDAFFRDTVRHGAFVNTQSFALIPSFRYVAESGLTFQTGLRLGLINNSSIRLFDSVFPSSGSAMGRFVRQPLESRPIPGLQADELSIMAGVGYTLRLDKTIRVRPEIIANIPLQAASETAKWKLSTTSLRFSLNVLFNTAKVIPVPDTVYRRDTTLQIVHHSQKPLLTLLSRKTDVRPAEYPEEPPTITITESYRRDIPKPKPLLTASIDAEFALGSQQSLGNQQFRRLVTLQAEKTLVVLTPVCANTTNASVYANVLQSYFAAQGLLLKTTQTSTNTIVSDTTILVSTLPKIRFTPRVVSENPLLGTRLQIFRQRYHQHSKNTGVRQLLATFLDSGETEPVIWNPAKMPDLLMNPNERLFYTFSVIDEEHTEIPADSGAINLRTEPIMGNLGLKRAVEVYAFEAELPLADFMRTLVAINIANTERVGIVAPSDSLNASETALRLQLLHRMIPNAERTSLTFNDVQSLPNLDSEPNIVPTGSEERTKRMREILSGMMLVFVERRL
jgi:hypothetical protein